METHAKRYKSNILGFYFGDSPLVVTMDYELSKELLTREEFQGRNETIINRTRGLGKLLGKYNLILL